MTDLPLLTRTEYLARLHQWAVLYHGSDEVKHWRSPEAFKRCFEFVYSWIQTLSLPELGTADQFCDHIRDVAAKKFGTVYGEQDTELRMWSDIHLRVRKSNLLYRLLYLGEDPRQEMCPKHLGHWSGYDFSRDPKDRCACASGINLTGWLPKENRDVQETCPSDSCGCDYRPTRLVPTLGPKTVQIDL